MFVFTNKMLNLLDECLVIKEVRYYYLLRRIKYTRCAALCFAVNFSTTLTKSASGDDLCIASYYNICIALTEQQSTCAPSQVRQVDGPRLLWAPDSPRPVVHTVVFHLFIMPPMFIYPPYLIYQPVVIVQSDHTDLAGELFELLVSHPVPVRPSCSSAWQFGR